jgi:hypothetical protein
MNLKIYHINRIKILKVQGRKPKRKKEENQSRVKKILDESDNSSIDNIEEDNHDQKNIFDDEIEDILIIFRQKDMKHNLLIVEGIIGYRKIN